MKQARRAQELRNKLDEIKFSHFNDWNNIPQKISKDIQALYGRLNNIVIAGKKTSRPTEKFVHKWFSIKRSLENEIFRDSIPVPVRVELKPVLEDIRIFIINYGTDDANETLKHLQLCH